MTSSDEKKRWQEEAEQLKNDLAQRQKIVQKREVEIKFGPGSANSTKSTSPQSASKRSISDSKSNAIQDSALRRMLGL